MGLQSIAPGRCRYSTGRVAWDLLATLAIGFTCVVTPLELFVLDRDPSSGQAPQPTPF